MENQIKSTENGENQPLSKENFIMVLDEVMHVKKKIPKIFPTYNYTIKLFLIILLVSAIYLYFVDNMHIGPGMIATVLAAVILFIFLLFEIISRVKNKKNRPIKARLDSQLAKIEKIANEEFTKIIKEALVDFLVQFSIPDLSRSNINKKLKVEISLDVSVYSFGINLVTNITDVFELKNESALFKTKQIIGIGVSDLYLYEGSMSSSWSIELSVRDNRRTDISNIYREKVERIVIKYF